MATPRYDTRQTHERPSWLMALILLLTLGLFGGHRLYLRRISFGLAQCLLTVSGLVMLLLYQATSAPTYPLAAFSLLGLAGVLTLTDLLALWWGGLYTAEGRPLLPRPGEKRLVWRILAWVLLIHLLHDLGCRLFFRYADTTLLPLSPAPFLSRNSLFAGWLTHQQPATELILSLCRLSVIQWIGARIATASHKVWHKRQLWPFVILPTCLFALLAVGRGWRLASAKLASFAHWSLARPDGLLSLSDWYQNKLPGDAFEGHSRSLVPLLLLCVSLVILATWLSLRDKILHKKRLSIGLFALSAFVSLAWLGFGHHKTYTSSRDAMGGWLYDLGHWNHNAFWLQWVPGFLCIAALVLLVARPADTSKAPVDQTPKGTQTPDIRLILALLSAFAAVVIAGWINEERLVRDWFAIKAVGCEASVRNAHRPFLLKHNSAALHEVWRVMWLQLAFVGGLGGWLLWQQRRDLRRVSRRQWMLAGLLAASTGLVAWSNFALRKHAASILPERIQAALNRPMEEHARPFPPGTTPRAWTPAARPLRWTSGYPQMLRLVDQLKHANAAHSHHLAVISDKLYVFNKQVLVLVVEQPLVHTATIYKARKLVLSVARERIHKRVLQRKKIRRFNKAITTHHPFYSFFSHHVPVELAYQVLQQVHAEGFHAHLRLGMPIYKRVQLRATRVRFVTRWVYLPIRLAMPATQPDSRATKGKKAHKLVLRKDRLSGPQSSISYAQTGQQASSEARLWAFLDRVARHKKRGKAPRKVRRDGHWHLVCTRDLPYHRLLAAVYLLHRWSKGKASVTLSLSTAPTATKHE